MIRKTVVYLSLVAVMLMSGACGFHLRGTDSTALVPRRWTVTGADSLLKNALENALRQAGARLDPEQADYGLRILELEEHSQADKLSGYRDELELRARLRWQWETAAGEALVPPEELERQRYVSVSRRYNAALVEQETARKALLEELAQAVIRRLAVLEKNRQRQGRLNESRSPVSLPGAPH